ncbi:MAG: DUF1501 domain-containing protein [Phycisphaeraceae bacterium]
MPSDDHLNSAAPTRRDALSWMGSSLTSTALLSLLMKDDVVQAAGGAGGAGAGGRSSIVSPHFTPTAKRVIHVCLIGGLSHLDSFDYKPALAKHHGQSLPGDEEPETFFGQVGLLRESDWKFRRRGQSGLWVSDLFPHIATVADQITVLKSMVAESANHTPATFEQSTGFRLNGFPTMGAWASYGLGVESDSLPAYVVLPDARGLPPGAAINWSNGFLPALHQGVPFQPTGAAIRDLRPSRHMRDATESASRELLMTMNQQHLARYAGDDEMTARMHSYELAARMQLAVPQVTDLSKESPATIDMYGINGEDTRDFGRSCLLARRLIEQGVRFVQLFSGGSFGSPRINWDGHENVVQNHTREAKRIDQPVAALMRDLQQRGMLDDTLVLFTTEFGRTPFTQSSADTVGTGRDHNMYGFSLWMAGGGLKPGTSYGSTDEIGWKAAENPLHWYDFHATMLHLLGIDHERLTYYHNGIERRLTNVHGHVIKNIIA